MVRKIVTISLDESVVENVKIFLKKQDGKLSGLINFLLSEWLRKEKDAEFTQKQLEELEKRKIAEFEKRKNKPLSIEEYKILLSLLSQNKEFNKKYNNWMVKNIKEGKHTQPN